MTRFTCATLVVLAGCALLGTACDTPSSNTTTRPSPAMSPAAGPGPLSAPALQYARATLPGAP